MMKKDLSKVDLALAIVVVLCLISPVSANEIWVLPTVDPPKLEVGNWGVTEKGDTHFSFAVPDNMAAFEEAKIVILGVAGPRNGWPLVLAILAELNDRMVPFSK